MPRRKRPPVPVHLTLPAEPPTQAEIDAITSALLSAGLMASDSIIGDAGRAGVTLILNGSRSQKVQRHEWDKLPEYGALCHLNQHLACCVHQHQARLRYEHTRNSIPLLFHTAIGWERIKVLWVGCIFDWFTAGQLAGTPAQVGPRLEIINHEIKYPLLRTMGDQPKPELTPVLHAWFPHGVRKIHADINHTLQTWSQRRLSQPQKGTLS